MREPFPEAERLVLVYDGDCGFCEATSTWLVDQGVIPESRRRPFQAFEGETEARLREAGIHNEIAILDPETDEVRTGLPGLVWIARPGPLGWLARAVDRWPVRGLASLGYRVISYNRRILAPIAAEKAAACNCDPDPHAGYRALFVGALLSWAILCFAAFGAVTAGWTGTPGRGAGAALLALAIGWGGPAVLGLSFGGARGGALMAHLAWTAAAAGLVLLLGLALLVPLRLVVPASLLPALIAGFAVGALVFAARVALRRAVLLGVPAGWVLLGSAFVVAGGLVAILRLFP